MAMAVGVAVAQLSAPGRGWAQSASAAPTAAAPASSAASSNAVPRPAQTLPTQGKVQGNGQQPLFFEADKLEGLAGNRTHASGSVRVKQGDMVMRADDLIHTQDDNTARATGNVRITNQGNLFSGPSLTLQLDTMEGEFIHPHFWLTRTQAGGDAELVEFLGDKRLRATRTTYSSCTPENTPDGKPGQPAWSLQTSQVYMDFEANEGRAENAVVWFQGVPILAAPTLTFPLTTARKSGFLPPSFYYDSTSGFEFSLPYYWNIAPDKDATLAPTYFTRRGVGLDLEYRYLTERAKGTLQLFALPDDQVAGRNRGMVNFNQTGNLNNAESLSQTSYDVRIRRVSDDDYWKDFTHALPSTTPRLYDSHASIEHTLNERNWGLGDSQTTVYGNVQTWQTLKDLDSTASTDSTISTPYRRTPQLGVRSRSGSETGLTWSVEGEFNRFTNEDTSKISGNRLNAIAQAERATDIGGMVITPKVVLRNTNYDLDSALSNGQRSASRSIPTFSLDATTSMERSVHMFDRDLIQTLEPRMLYVRTPYQDQSILPTFDTAARDFNQYSIYNDNAYTGVDRISDANQVTVGTTSRLIDSKTGVETLRLGIAQKILLAEQRINPDGDEPITQRYSDMFLLGSTSVIPNWSLDSTVRLGAKSHQTEQATYGIRYSPGAWRTVSLSYTYTRDSTEQVTLGWQWPIAGRKPSLQQVFSQASSTDVQQLNAQRSSPQGDCSGTWYSVGRLIYSTRDERLLNTLAGVEYDAGCWIGRVVLERVAVGTSTVSSRIMFQLELIGLSRLSLGTNPLRTLKENVPGYTLLRGNTAQTSTGATPLTSSDD
jgi:LPS-assembly protein